MAAASKRLDAQAAAFNINISLHPCGNFTYFALRENDICSQRYGSCGELEKHSA
jgi:hypothetical protein